MEAGSILRRAALALTLLGLMVGSAAIAKAGDHRTQNFIVHAPDDQLAAAVAEAAEKYRHDLAIYWLGQALPPWQSPCPIRVIAGPRLAAQGVTTYNPRPVRDFQMEVVGTPERILDSVLPHEVTHTILATHFGRPLPRWADEGICTTVEHSAERNKHELKLREFLATRRGIAMNQLFLLTEYPADMLPMYAQGYSVCRFLIDQKGPRAFIAFLHDYMRHPSWTANIKKHYQYDSLKELQEYWLAWVSDGSRDVEKFAKVTRPAAPAQNGSVMLATAEIPTPAPDPTPLQLAGPSGAPVSQRTIGPDSIAPKSMAASATRLASNDSQGWYQRKKQQAAAKQSPDGATAVGSVMPPSVRQSGPYQSAHPQPIQGISRSPRVSGPSSTDGSRFR